MARKRWSYVFFLAGFLNGAAAMLPSNPVKIADWLMLPCCLVCGFLIRRPMIGKVRNVSINGHWLPDSDTLSSLPSSLIHNPARKS